MEFEWHETKRESNLNKHGIDFRDIPGIWESVIAKEPRDTHGEQRTTAYGTLRERVIVIVYTIRHEAIRLISARSASRDERADHASITRRVYGPKQD